MINYEFYRHVYAQCCFNKARNIAVEYQLMLKQNCDKDCSCLIGYKILQINISNTN